MERKIGDTFEYEGKTLKVVEQAICKAAYSSLEAVSIARIEEPK